MKLYYAPFTRSTRPRWLLEELGVPYELVRVDLAAGGNETPEYLAVNPLGAVPSLVDGDQVILESAAIVMVLADKFAEKGLAPALNTPERAKYTQWMFFSMSTLEPVVVECAGFSRAQADGKPFHKSEAEVKESFDRLGNYLEAHFAQHSFAMGQAFSAADVPLGAILAWARSLKRLEAFPHTLAYVARLTERPAFKVSRK